MADENNLDIGTPSRLSENSADFRICSIAKNSSALAKDKWGGYTPGNEYCAGIPDTQSDGDNRGRDPQDGNQQSLDIGTKTDIAMRQCLMAKNTPTKADDNWTGYNRGNQYCAGSEFV